MGAESAGVRLNELLAEAGLPELHPQTADRFQAYLTLLMRWNAHLNLTAIRDEEGILSRHFLESIACARTIPAGVGTLLDFGSGAGFPGIPIALCRPEISVTLGESQAKKAAFLQEALRTLGLRATVYGGRAETLKSTFDCVVLRAVDRMGEAVTAAVRLVSPGGWLLLMTTSLELQGLEKSCGGRIRWARTHTLPQSADRIIAIGSRPA